MLKIKIPDGFHFDGAKFGKHFFPDFDPNVPDPRFWMDTERNLICPSLELETIDLTIFEAQPTQPVTLSALQEEITQIKKEIEDLKKKIK